MSAPNGEKINRKKLEHMERMRKKNEAKTSKSKIKKLARIVERKKLKETRDSLIEQLGAYQNSTFTNLIPTAKMHVKDFQSKTSTEKPTQPGVQFPKKLRCVNGKNLAQNVSENRKRQANYYETGSSFSESEANSANNIENGRMSCSDIILLDEPKLEPVDNVEQHSEPILPTKSKTSGEIVETDEDSPKALSEDFFKSLAKIKGKKIAVPRLDAIETQRQKLPIYAEEQEIVEGINENTVVLVCGETGSGKTTQIPQFLYEAGYTSNGHLIGVTEPRRIAAISMAERVGRELCAPELCSYQIRFEGNRTDATKILFMTDGVLLRELQTDVTLSRFSAIVIDEAHERSVYSDVLIGLLSRICVARLRRGVPLKLIIMSATLRLSDFLQERLFPKIKPKVIKVEARQFSVDIHFERRTPTDYLKAAFRKVCKIHERLPDGGILVFLSGQREVEQLIKWLAMKFPPAKDTNAISAENGDAKSKRRKLKRKRKEGAISGIPSNDDGACEDMVVDYEEFGAADADNKEAGSLFDNIMTGGKAIEEDEEFLQELRPNRAGEEFPPLHCLPLYSLLSSDRQRAIFRPIPVGSRLCVVATNVAETSLTIPNIRYVVDCGKEKRRHFDPITGVSQFCVEWISRASADQRSGRAGRVQAGHAYRLYSSAVFEDFVKFSAPDILNQPIEQLVLHLKAMNFTKLMNFPFPTPPDADQVEVAERRLIHLGALERESEKSDARITELGKTLAQIPLSPQFAHLIARSNSDALLPYAIALVAVLSVREPLVALAQLRRDSAEATQNAMAIVLKQRRAWCAVGEARHLGDLCVLLHLIGAADNEPKMTPHFLEGLGLRPKPYFEIRRLRRQLTNVVNASSTLEDKILSDFKLSPPSQAQMRLLRELMTLSLPEQIAMRVDRSIDNSNVPKGAYKCQRLEEFVFIDSTSMMYKEEPEFVLYQEIVQLGQKKCMQTMSSVETEWIPDFAKTTFNLGKPK